MPIYIKFYVSGSNTQDAVQISRISMTPGDGGVEGRDPAAMVKVEQLINMARRQGPSGNLYIATDAGVYQNSPKLDPQGRLALLNRGTVEGCSHPYASITKCHSLTAFERHPRRAWRWLGKVGRGVPKASTPKKALRLRDLASSR